MAPNNQWYIHSVHPKRLKYRRWHFLHQEVELLQFPRALPVVRLSCASVTSQHNRLERFPRILRIKDSTTTIKCPLSANKSWGDWLSNILRVDASSTKRISFTKWLGDRFITLHTLNTKWQNRIRNQIDNHTLYSGSNRLILYTDGSQQQIIRTVLNNTDHASLWNAMITDVVGNSASYFMVVHLINMKSHWKRRNIQFEFNVNIAHFFFRTSGSVRFSGIRSLANKLNRLIENCCCIFSISLCDITTGLPLAPSPSIGAKWFWFKTSVIKSTILAIWL